MRNKALSPFISSALLIMLSIVAISLTLTIINPALNKGKDSAVINEALSNLEMLDDNIKEIASEGEGARRTIYLKVTDGMYRVDSTNAFINFTYRTEAITGLSLTGKRGDVNLTSSGRETKLFIEYTNIDFQSSEHFTKGDNSILILHNGTNSTTNHPIIYVGR